VSWGYCARVRYGDGVETRRGPRAARIGDAAIVILAERGMRGLTHRAVDQAAGLPPGTTSNYARTRAALVELALDRMTDLETADIAPRLASGVPADAEGFADLAAAVIHHSITVARTRMLARYELALEATRRPELRTIYDRAGELYRGGTPALLAAIGSADPDRHARMFTAWVEGIMFDMIAGAGWRHEPTVDELRASLLEYLRAIISGSADASPKSHR
jgi:DNA-binding transcriptional regulator YbjK